MSSEMTTEVEVKAPKTEKAKAPKAKKTAKKVAKKTAKKGKTAKAPRAKKDGLRKPQIRILQCLAKAKAPFSRAQIAEKAPCDVAWLNSWIGSRNIETRAKNDQAGFLCLLSLALVKEHQAKDGQRGVAYEITAAGRKAISAL